MLQLKIAVSINYGIPYSRILFSNKKELTIDTYNNTDESQMYFAGIKKTRLHAAGTEIRWVISRGWMRKGFTIKDQKENVGGDGNVL